MVENRRIGKVAIKGKRTGNVVLADIIDQLLAQHRMVLERNLQTLAKVLLLKAAELQRIMLAAGADVIDNKIIVGDLIALLGMIPEPAHIGNEFAAMVDQGVVNGDDPLLAIA